MTGSAMLEAIRAVVQRDPGGRGLDHPDANLFDYCAEDLSLASKRLAGHPAPVLGVVTGFWIPSAGRFETDGPPGAVFLARVLGQMGIEVRLFTDCAAVDILRTGLFAAGCHGELVSEIPPALPPEINLLLALERVGPGHTLDSLRAQPGNTSDALGAFAAEVPVHERGRCRTMRGTDITEQTTPVESWFGSPRLQGTIGVGDGGNEIGMGKIPWSVLRRAVPRGGRIACRVPADHLIVAGVSNWGAYALAAGVACVRGMRSLKGAFDPCREEKIIQAMVGAGLIDGVSGGRTATVDGLPWPVHAEVLRRLGEIVEGEG